MTLLKLRRFRFSMRGAFSLFTVAIVGIGWLGWQKSIVQRRQAVASRLYQGDKNLGFRGRAYAGERGEWTIRPFKAVKTATLVEYPPQTTEPLSRFRVWLGDKHYAVVVVRNESACPQVRDIFPEATIVVLNRDGATIRARGKSSVWPVIWFDPQWPNDL